MPHVLRELTNMRTSQVFAAAISVLFLCPGYATQEGLRTLVPADAKSVEFRAIGSGRQVTYSVDREYPSTGIKMEGLERMRQEGWIYCKKGGDWSSFVDGTAASPARIYQRLSYLKREGSLITIGERYYVENPSPPQSHRPDHRKQDVAIVQGEVGVAEIAALLESSRAACEHGGGK